MFSQAGRVGPAYCTGVGKAMLAFLPERKLEPALKQQSYHRFTNGTLDSEDKLREELKNIQSRGFAYDREEHEPGIVCVAAPILSQSKQVLGAISITTSTNRKSLNDLEALVPYLQKTGVDIAGEAQFWRFPDDLSQMKATGTQ